MKRVKAIPAPFTKGVNFSNWLEFKTADQIDTEYFTKKDFANAKALGCDAVRIPIHFEQMCAGSADYKVPARLFEVLDNVASWAEELQMYVIFDFHNNIHINKTILLYKTH